MKAIPETYLMKAIPETYLDMTFQKRTRIWHWFGNYISLATRDVYML
jgi:hypothetical protein